MAAFLGSIYAFFLLELLFSKHHDHSHEAEMESVFEVILFNVEVTSMQWHYIEFIWLFWSITGK